MKEVVEIKRELKQNSVVLVHSEITISFQINAVK
jgi:hypothetical protein